MGKSRKKNKKRFALFFFCKIYIELPLIASLINFGLFAYLRPSSSDIVPIFMRSIISFSSTCIHSLDHICIIEGSCGISFSLMRFAIAAFFTIISFTSLTPVPSLILRSLCDSTATIESAN